MQYTSEGKLAEAAPLRLLAWRLVRDQPRPGYHPHRLQVAALLVEAGRCGEPLPPAVLLELHAFLGELAEAEQQPLRADLERLLFAVPWQPGHLHVEQFRSLEALDLTFHPQAGESQWIFFAGENGVGKTTILRSICLSLVSDGVGRRLVDVENDRRARLVRAGKTEARVQLQGTWDLPERVLQDEHGKDRLVDRPEAHPLPFLAAYGARRGSAIGGQTVEIRDLLDSEYHAVASLMEEGAPLVAAASWLEDERGAALEAGPNSPRAAYFDAVVRTLARLLPGGTGENRIEIRAGQGCWVSGPRVGERTPLSGLSDGYLTTLGWVVDLIARWSRRALALGVELTGEFAAQMAGVVLVDDVDVHLHPTWQYELVEQLRELFPRLTFVVSTHNPVTLLGARPGELYLVFHDEAGAVEVLQQDLPPGADVDSILLGVWFRLETTLDPTTAELHRELQTAYREAPESERVQQLRRQLRERNPHRFRALARSRLAEQVAEVMGEEDGLSPEQRRKLIESLRERAARNRAKREPHDPAPTV